MNPADYLYLDHAATTPVRQEVWEAMRPHVMGGYGNASSLHRFGRDAKKAIDRAREQVASLINADPRDLVFTSGGTEANNLALRGSADSGRRILASAVEHHSVLRAAETITEISVDAEGLVEVDRLESELSDDAIVSLMHGNNETGTVQPIAEVAASCHDRGALFHTDAVQSAGRIPIDVETLPVDLLSLSAHKLYGPKGAGALFVRRGTRLAWQMRGGSQERGRRAGTENVAALVGFGEACALARRELETENIRQSQLRDAMEIALLNTVPGSWVNGSRRSRLPHILHLGFPGVEGETIMLGLDQEGIAVSTGSACNSGSVDASHVLLAMGQSHAKAHGGVRISLGRETKESSIPRLCESIKRVVAASS